MRRLPVYRLMALFLIMGCGKGPVSSPIALEQKPAVLKAKLPKPDGAGHKRAQAPIWAVAPAGSLAHPDKIRRLELSASGITLDLPKENVQTVKSLALKGNRALQDGNYEAAHNFFERAALRTPHDASAWYGAALACYAKGLDSEAWDRASKALAIDSAHAGSHLLVGYLDQMAARIPDAIEHYRTFLKSKPPEPVARDVRTIIDQLTMN